MSPHSTPVYRNTIMVVDDEPKNIQLLGTLLTQNNYNIIPAQNGIKALEKLAKVTPDLILLDVMMPEMDGFETCRRIKESEDTKNIPVIFITAKVDKEDIINGLSAGAVDYITKPFNQKELLMRVKTHLDLINTKNKLQLQMNTTNELLHVLCHDLTNPLGSISSLLEVIEDESDLKELLPVVCRAADDCLEIITLIKEMSAIDVGKTILCVSKVDLYEAVNGSILTLENKIQAKNINIVSTVSKDTFVLAEKVVLKNSILNNILTNAIKFSQRGGKIDISCEQTDTMAELHIRDHRIGIPETLLEKIFHPGKSTNRKGTEGETGTGFGMPIVKKFMEKFNGSIEVLSKEASVSDDCGTEIILSFKKY